MQYRDCVGLQKVVCIFTGYFSIFQLCEKAVVMSKNQGGHRISALQDLRQIVFGWPYFVCSSICKKSINNFFFPGATIF